VIDKLKYLIGGLTSLFIAGVLQQLVFSEANTELFVEHVKEKLAIETEVLDDQIFQLKRKLKEDEQVNFDHILEGGKYPIAVYRNKKLIFWSDHTRFIDYYDISGYYDERCFETPRENGIYLAKKSFLTLKNQDYEIVGLIPLQSRYQEANNFLAPTLNQDIFLQGQGVKISIAKGGTPIINPYDIYLFSIIFSNDFTYYSSHRWIVPVSYTHLTLPTISRV